MNIVSLQSATAFCYVSYRRLNVLLRTIFKIFPKLYISLNMIRAAVYSRLGKIPSDFARELGAYALPRYRRREDKYKNM
jgi:hypothetical protein